MSRREETIVRIIYFCGKCDYGVFTLVNFLGDAVQYTVYVISQILLESCMILELNS